MYFLFRMAWCNITAALKLCLGICHKEVPRKSEGTELNGMHKVAIYAVHVNFLDENVNTMNRNPEILRR
jgi:hypothetical protein